MTKAEPGSARPDIQDAAAQIARSIGERLCVPADAEAFAKRAPLPPSLAAGHAGLALLFTALEDLYPEEPKWAGARRSYLAAAAQSRTHGSGLFGGWGGVLLAARYARAHGYGKLIGTLQPYIETGLLKDSERREVGNCSEYDLINGLSGVAIAAGRECDAASANSFVDFAEWLIQDLDRWYVPKVVTGERAHDIGVSHGIAGLLAALLALPITGRTNDVAEAVAQALADAAIRTQAGIEFPATADNGPTRVAWCYGTPGVAAVLWRAAKRLGRADFQRTAGEAMRSLLSRPRETWGVTSHTLCHGTIGVVLCLRVISEDAELQHLADVLIAEIVQAFDPSRPLGYDSDGSGEHPEERCELLEGACGIALGLLTAVGMARGEWLRAFAI